MINLKVTESRGEDKSLVVASMQRGKKNYPIEYYSVKNENTDRFMKEREGLYFNDALRTSMAAGCATLGGFGAAHFVKSKLTKVGLGLLAGICLYKGLSAICKEVHDMQINGMLKRNEAEDVTKEYTK